MGTGTGIGSGSRTPDRGAAPSCRSFAIVVSLALTVVAIALLVPAVRRMLGVIRSGQPAPGRNENPTGRAATMLKETFLHTRMLQWHWVGIMHWFVYAGVPVPQHGRAGGVLPALQARLRLSDHRPLVPLRVAHGGHRGAEHGRHRLPDRLPPEAPPAQRGPQQPLLRLERCGRPTSSRPWRCSRARRSCSSGPRSGGSTRRPAAPHYPFSSWLGDALYPSSVASLENLIYFIAMFKIALGDGLADGDRPQHHHGHRLAPVHGLVQHLLQARVRRQHGAGRDEAADLGRQGDHPRRHRRPRRGLDPRRRLDRGLLLEGHPRLHDLHRVRPLPVAVPGVEHREAALAQAADHGPARPRLRQGGRRRAPTPSVH